MESTEQLLARLRLENAQLTSANTQLQAYTRPTTMPELLEHCHRAFVHKLNVERDPSLRTGGSTTAVTNKLRPARLEPWGAFMDLRRSIFSRAEHFLQQLPEDEQRCYDNPNQIQGAANNARADVSSEIDLRHYHQNSVEPFVQKVLKQLITLHEARKELRLGEDMFFENHANSLAIFPSQDEHGEKLYRPKDADQICVRRDNGNNSAAVIVEFKAPHKATPELLTAGLHSMDVGEVVRLKGTTAKKEDQFQKSADLFVAMIVTQTYSYMVESGVSHGCIITGEALIFLLVEESEPDTVYFYHADPKAEVAEERKSGKFPHECTTIGQLLSFCLLAHGRQLYPQSWRFNARSNGLRWAYSAFEAEQAIPTEAAEFDLPQSARKTRQEITMFYRSPIVLRPRPRCNPDDVTIKRESDGSDDSGSEYGQDQTPTRPRRRQQQPSQPKLSQGNPKEGKQTSGSAGGTAKDYAFCTQRCLLGLTSRSAMDKMCPNYALHPKGKAGDVHALTRPLLARHIRQQLATDLDDYCVDLYKQGATGRLFKLTLVSHGYTFVGKGTVKGYIARSKFEGRVYNHLKARQGQSIPVHLGNIDLLRPWIGGGFDIVHMLLMSWAGDCVIYNIARDEAGTRLVNEQAKRFNGECIKIGACHRDTYLRNMVWNEENQQVMFIDFDQTVLFDVRQRPPGEVLYFVQRFLDWWEEGEDMVDDTGAVVVFMPKQSSTATRIARQHRPATKQTEAPRLGDFNIWSDEAEQASGPPSKSNMSSQSGTKKSGLNWVIRSDSEGENGPDSPRGLKAGSTHGMAKVQDVSQDERQSAKVLHDDADKENVLTPDVASGMAH
ncbi:MAG: hypothetical protein L6R39_000894 [Caloplaca ligustica]|nr:MAG: hypothetical protein L6R39_000894 [Caloplaca ligustica]